MDYQAAVLQLKEDLRLRTEPLGVNFLNSPATWARFFPSSCSCPAY